VSNLSGLPGCKKKYAGSCNGKGQYRPSARPDGRAEKQGNGAVAT